MNDMTLAGQRCIPCESGTPPLNSQQIQALKTQLKKEWELIEDKKLKHQFKFDTFAQAIDFVNKVANIAETENHHPNVTIIYNKVVITLTTHSIGGLSQNDFIVAAKIENLV